MPVLRKRILELQVLTILWMTTEVVISVYCAVMAHSVALAGFGGDSAIELLSASVVFLRFRNMHFSEMSATRVTAWLLFALAAFIVGSSIFALADPRLRPQPSRLGMALLAAAAGVMPWLARQKKKLAIEAKSGSLNADAAQSSLCAYLAWIALCGLVFNAMFKVSWADPVAALLLLPIIWKEGREAWQGKACGDCAC
jgi:divalent metal cation (Fe/Co/Zn/Cd) transporter